MRIAIIQKDYEDASRARIALTRAGHRCWISTNRASIMQALGRTTIDFLLLDWRAGDCNGMDLVRWTKEDAKTTLISAFYTDHADAKDIAAAFAAGATDYIIKPVDESELVARVTTQLQKTYFRQYATDPYSVGPYTVDPDSATLIYKQREVELTQTEYRIATALFKNIGRALSRDYIHELVSDDVFAANSRSLDSQISTIRIKLRLMPERGFQLRAIYGYGYRLDQIEQAKTDSDRRTRDVDWSMISTIADAGRHAG